MQRLLFLILLIGLATPASAATHKLTYDISFIGIPIGSLVLRVTLDGAAYDVRVNGGFGGLAGLFTNATAHATATGTITGGQLEPFRLKQYVAWDEEPRTIDMQFKDGDVVAYTVTPPYNFNPETRVPLVESTLKNVHDPLSALLQLHPHHKPVPKPKRGKKQAAVTPPSPFCSGAVRVFDGRERYDLVLTPVAGRDELTCRLTPKLIGGYKRKYDLPDYEPESAIIQFTPLVGTQLVVPKLAERAMRLGHLHIELVSVEQE